MYLNWETHAQDYYAIDIETESLTPNILWCMCWENIKTKEKGECLSVREVQEFFKRTRGSVYIGHNILGFDLPVLSRLAGIDWDIRNVIDTLVLSTLYYPSLPEGHSLDAWGQRLGEEKIPFHAFDHYSEDMLKYCHQDVTVCSTLFRRLVKVLVKTGFSEKTCEIQHKITHIINKQRENGFYFDGPRAIAFYQELRGIEEGYQSEIRNAFPPERVLVRNARTHTSTGNLSAIYQKDIGRYITELDGEGGYSAYEDVPFNIGSPKQRVERLTALGWEATEFTPKGQPKATEKSLVEFSEEKHIPEIALITKWMAVNGRANMVNTWLDNWNEDTGCIHGKLFVADTLRFRHQSPNTANIPAVRITKQGDVLRGESGYWTYESRDLWCARPGRVLVGTDASGLELRMLAHYLNRASFTDEVVNGDPHQYNADVVGITRPSAKTLLYAIMYGAQGPKVAKTIGCSVLEGVRVRQQFLDRLGLTDIMNGAIYEQETGRVWLCDGAGLVCPSPHAALNYKLQGGGARVMAQGAIFLDGYIQRSGLDSLKVGDIHDEWQYDVDPRDASEHARLSIQAIRDAGEELNLNVPLDAEAKEGRTWAETH